MANPVRHLLPVVVMTSYGYEGTTVVCCLVFAHSGGDGGERDDGAL